MSEHGASSTSEIYVSMDERIKYWDEIIAGVPEKTREAFSPIATMAIAELDKQAVLSLGIAIGEDCVVSGTAAYAEQDTAKDTEESESDVLSDYMPMDEPQLDIKYENINAKRGYFGGLTIQRLNNESEPRLWYLFQHGYYDYDPNPFVKGPVPRYMYVDPATATIVPVAAFEIPFTNRQPKSLPKENTIVEDLVEKSAELSRILGTKKFKRLPRLEQLNVVDTIISETEELTDILHAGIILTADHGYIANNEFENRGYEEIDIKNVFLSGACLALNMLGSEKLLHTPIRKKDDVMSLQKGITLALELDDQSDLGVGLPLKNGSIVQIPLFGQSVEMTVR